MTTRDSALTTGGIRAFVVESSRIEGITRQQTHDPYVLRRGFLHTWCYQSLSAAR